jgi:hypothetical protein
MTATQGCATMGIEHPLMQAIFQIWELRRAGGGGPVPEGSDSHRTVDGFGSDPGLPRTKQDEQQPNSV